jgi:membrane-associated protease RseP (regulator of RpoE activity)
MTFSTGRGAAEKMRFIVTLVAASIPCVFLHVGSMALSGLLLGATLEEVSWFFGPPYIRIRIGQVNCRFGLIPFGGYAKFKGDQTPRKATEEPLFAADLEPPGFNDLHPIKRAAIHASGCLVLIILAVLCLGPVHATRSLGRGFVQFVPFAPWTPAWVPEGRELAARFLSVFRNGPYPFALGVLAAKLAAANLFPVPPMNGGQLILTLMEWKRSLPDKVTAPVVWVGILACLTIVLYWAFQFAAILLRSF